MSDDLNTEIKIGADASGVEAGVSRAKRSIASLGDAAKKAGKDGGDGLAGIGAGGDKASKDVERATANMKNSIQRQIAVMQAGSKESRAYWETLANQRGLNTNALRPYLDQLEKVTAETGRAKRATDDLQKTVLSAGRALGGLLGGVLAGFSLTKFISETVNAQQQQVQLAAVLKSTGEAAGLSLSRLNAMAAGLSKASVFNAGEIAEAQTRLLSYTGIVGTQFPRAMQNVIDMAQRMGMDVKSSAETIGRALDIPSEGLTALQRQGFRFTEAQKEMVKQLEETGRVGEAQAIIMEALESSYGGAAAAAKDTLGGALAQLRTNVSELMTGGDGSISGLTSLVKTLGDTVVDLDVIIRAASSSVDGLSKSTGALATMREGAATFFETVAVLAANTLYVLKQTGDTMGGIAAGYKAFFSFDFDAVRAIGAEMKANGEQARREIDATTARILNARKEAALYSSYDTRNASAATDPRRLDLRSDPLGPASPAAAAKKVSAIGSVQNAYASLISSINKKIEAERQEMAGGEKLTASQRERIKLDADLAAGRVKLTASQVASVRASLDMLSGIEAQNSAAKEAMKIAQALEATRNKEAMAAAASVQGINDKAQALEDEIAVYGMGAQAIAALTIERLEEKKAILSGFGASSDVIAQIEAEIEARGRLASAKGMKDGMDESAAAAKKALAELDAFLDPAKASSFGDALTSAFEGAGSALANMVNHLDSYAQKEAEIAKMRANLSAETDPAQRVQKEMALANLAAKAQINAYASMAGAAKGFFKEGSAGYKAMGAVEKTYRAAELAMAVKNMAVKMGLIGTEVAATVAAQGSMTAASNASEAARMPAKIAGTFAAFTSMMGPFGIPAAIAALAAVGIAAAGGSSSNDLPATNMGTGTVFGDKDAKSESIEKTIDLLEGISKFAGIENSYAANMLTSLRSIEQQIGGFTNVILRAGGVEAAGAGVAVGTKGLGINWGIDGLTAKITNALFNTKTTITGQGIYANDATLASIAAGGMDAGYYADVNKKKKAFGITYSDKNSTQFNKDNEVSRQISLLLTDFADSVKLAAPVLGMSLDTIDSRLNDFVVSIGRVDLKDLTGTEIQEKLNAVFGAAGDNIAQAAVPGLEHLQAVGEGYFETLARVASNLSSVNQMFDTLSVKLYDSSIAGAEMSIQLAELFGGLENMASVVGDYYESFYSEEERKATMQRQLSAAFADLQLTMPDIDASDARDQFRALAEAQDLSTEAGRKAYASLLQLSGAFASITISADDAASALAEAAKKAKEAAEEAARNAIDSAYRSLQNASALERKQLDLQRGLAQESVSMLSGVFKLVRDSARSLYSEVESTAAMQAAQGMSFIDDALRTARANGGMPDRDALGTAITAARSGLDANSFASQAEMEFQKQVLAGKLTTLGDISEVQLTTAERTLKGITTQIDQQDAMLAYWKQQIDLSRGSVDATLSVADAVAKLQELMFPSKAAEPAGTGSGGKFAIGGSGSGGGGATVTPEQQAASDAQRIRDYVGMTYGSSTNYTDKAALGQISAMAGMEGWTAAEIGSALGIPAEGIRDLMLGAGFDWWRGPSYAVGTNYVQRDQLAMVHEGEAIVPRAYNPAAGAQGAGNAELVAELRALRAEVAELKGLQAEGNRSAHGTHDLLDRVTAGGNAMAIEDMNA